MKRVVIIGCGYLGSHLANYFNGKDLKVIVLGRKSIYAEILHSDISFIEVDVNNIDKIKKNISINDTVLYAAGSLNATNTFEDILPDIQDYYTSFIMLLDESAKIGIRKFVFLSSAGTVYGNTISVAKEEDCLNPTNIYGLQKVYFENVIKIKHLESNSLPYLILRVSNPYGGFQNPNKKQGIIPVLINKALNNEEFVFWGNAAAVRDFIYIDDFLEAIYRTLLLEDNQIINIGSGTETSISHVISTVEEKSGELIDIVHKNLGAKTIMNNRLDISKLEELTGFCPPTKIEDGIAIIVCEAMRIKNSV